MAFLLSRAAAPLPSSAVAEPRVRLKALLLSAALIASPLAAQAQTDTPPTVPGGAAAEPASDGDGTSLADIPAGQPGGPSRQQSYQQLELLAQLGEPVRTVQVEGNQRIEEGTIASYLTVKPGDRLTAQNLDQSLKSLFATGLFADVQLQVSGSILIVQVVENPIINRIAFEGNRGIKSDDLQREVQLRPRQVFTRTRVQTDAERISELYRRQGRYSSRIDPKVVMLPQNRVDLVFEIYEGDKTPVEQIFFVGNKLFDDDTLKGEIRTKEYEWWRFFASDDNYDPDRFNVDRELLRRFYLTQGYADFRVVSSVAELTPDRSAFFLTFAVEEGEQYRVGEVKVSADISEINTDALAQVLPIKSGEIFDASKIEDSTKAISELAQNLNYAFAEVEPQSRKNRDTKTIDLDFQVKQGSRTFIERIDIAGNTRTVDEVIRREMLISEGDAYSGMRIKQSEQRLRDLGYFSDVKLENKRGSQPDRSVVETTVTEQSTGEISLGAGVSTSEGGIADIRIRERNLLGEGKDMQFSITVSGRQQQYDIGYTEPYFLNRDLAFGVDIFRIDQDLQDEGSYDLSQTGGALRLGYPLSDRLRQRLLYRVEQNDIRAVAWDASRFVYNERGKSTTSLIGQQLTYDDRNSRLNPSDGFYLTLTTDLAGLGGDVKFVRGSLGGAAYWPIYSDWVFSVAGEVGYITGLGGEKVRLSDRYYLGGDRLRGFETGGIGPRDSLTDDALGGNRFVRGSTEISVPVGLPKEYEVKGHLFVDAGTLGGIDDSDPLIQDKESLRASAGIGVSFRSPMGPIRLDLAYPFAKEPFDKTEAFKFSFQSRF